MNPPNFNTHVLFCLLDSQWMIYLPELCLTSSHSVFFLSLSLTPSKSVWQSFLSLFPGMAPIRDSVSHSPNQTGDYTWPSLFPFFFAFHSFFQCHTLNVCFVILRVGTCNLSLPWLMMHFIHGISEIQRKMNEWEGGSEGVQEESWQANTIGGNQNLEAILCERGFEKWVALWVRGTHTDLEVSNHLVKRLGINGYIKVGTQIMKLWRAWCKLPQGRRLGFLTLCNS